MKIPFYDLGPQHDMVRSGLADAFNRVNSRQYYIQGPELEAFEQAFAEYCGVKHCIGVGNGLEAISLALRAFGIGPGDDVLVPSHTFIATWLGASQIGANPIPVEVDPRTCNLDPGRLAEACTTKTKAIIPVHLYGQPADMPAIMAFADEQNLIVIEDAAQAHGAMINGQKVGSFGHAAAFSFYPTKNLGALGDGGAVVTSDADIARKIRLFGNYGSEKKYEHQILAGNSRLDELQAAFLHAKLPFLDQWNQERRQIAALYTDSLKETPGIEVPHVPNWASPVWHQYVIKADDRNRLMQAFDKVGIGWMIHYPKAPHIQGAYNDHAVGKMTLPIAEELAKKVISIPIWPGITRGMIEYISTRINSNIRYSHRGMNN